MAADSGACDNVIDPADVPMYDVTESAESKRGDGFSSATNEEIPNLGDLKIPMLTREGTVRGMKMCAAPVARPLASVRKMNEAGHVVVFDLDGSFILNKSTGEINMLRHEGGNFMLDVLIPPPGTEPEQMVSFGRLP